jgi:hemerythrin
MLIKVKEIAAQTPIFLTRRVIGSAATWGASMRIEWDARYNIADEQINRQHKYLFQLANRFLAADTKSELLVCAQSLFEYTQSHFAYEEALMLEHHFPEYDQHVISHQHLIERLAALRGHISGDSLDKLELKNFMGHWALFHIPEADARLAEYLVEGDTQRAELAPGNSMRL